VMLASAARLARHFSSMPSGTPTIAVVLSGCGVFDGTEVHEAAAVLAGVTRGGAAVSCYAPTGPQMHTVDHLKGAPSEGQERDILAESARIARGAVKPLSELSTTCADAVIFPGGFGAAKNLSNFAVAGGDMAVKEDVARVIKDFHAAGKPIGLCCISPVLAAKVLGDKGVTLTMGRASGDQWPHAGAVEAAKGMGAVMVEKEVNEVVVDEANKVVTTPAYMFDGQFHQIQDGVSKMVDKVLKMI